MRFLAPPVAQNVSMAEGRMMKPRGLEDAYEITDPVTDQENRPQHPQQGERNLLLVVRCFRTRWRAVPADQVQQSPVQVCGRHHRQLYCGHQVGVSVADVDGSVMGVSDADAVQGSGRCFGGRDGGIRTATKRMRSGGDETGKRRCRPRVLEHRRYAISTRPTAHRRLWKTKEPMTLMSEESMLIISTSTYRRS